MSIGKAAIAKLASNIKEGIANRLKDLHTNMPGIIESFDPITQTASIQPAIKRVFITREGVTEIGADVTTLLNPSLLPNRAFLIESVNADVTIGNLFFRNIKRTTAEGLYKIQEVVFKGDSRDGDWLSSVKGRIIQ